MQAARRDFLSAARTGSGIEGVRSPPRRGAALQAFFLANAGRALLPGNETSGALSPHLKDEEP